MLLISSITHSALAFLQQLSHSVVWWWASLRDREPCHGSVCVCISVMGEGRVCMSNSVFDFVWFCVPQFSLKLFQKHTSSPMVRLELPGWCLLTSLILLLILCVVSHVCRWPKTKKNVSSKSQLYQSPSKCWLNDVHPLKYDIELSIPSRFMGPLYVP